MTFCQHGYLCHAPFDWSISANCLQGHLSPLFLRRGWPPEFSFNVGTGSPHRSQSIPLLTDLIGEQWRINAFLDRDPQLFRESDCTKYALILFTSRIHFAKEPWTVLSQQTNEAQGSQANLQVIMHSSCEHTDLVNCCLDSMNRECHTVLFYLN